MRPISEKLGRLRRPPLAVIVALVVLGAAGWAVAQPPLQLTANCAGGGYGGVGTGGYGAPDGTCGPYVPLPPTRVLDTRNGIGASTGAVGPGQSVTLTIAGANGVPAMPGASAVVLNVTVVGLSQAAASDLTVWPDGQTRPNASNLNYVEGETVANLVEVQLGANGAVDFFNIYGYVYVVADLEGYVATTATGSAGLFNAMPGHRVLDTRYGTGGITGPVVGGQTIRVPVEGVGGIPTTGVEAVVFNLTVTAPNMPSDVTAYPDCNTCTRPNASNINFGPGETICNRVIVPVKDGYVDLYNVQGDVQLIVDLNGYFTDSTVPANSGSDFNAEPPVRIVDTRPNSGIPYSGAPLPPGGTLLVQVAGSAGVPAMTSTAPPTAVVLNVTEASANAASWVAVWPSNVAQPLISDINFVAGQVQPNLVVVQLSPAGQLKFYNDAGTTNIVVDVEGWYS